MKSAGVHPFHSACLMVQYAFSSLPGLSTTIIAATIKPRYTSRHISLLHKLEFKPLAELAGE